MTVVVVDPSDFTPPYDQFLMRSVGMQNTVEEAYLIGAGRGREPQGYTYVSFFYRLSEQLRSLDLPQFLYLAVKGGEHIIDLVRLWWRISTLRPDVIHFQWLSLPIVDRRFIPLFSRIAPVVLTVHDTTPFNDNPPSRLQKYGWKKALQAFDALIAHTEFSASRLQNMGIDGDKIFVIPHGILDEGVGGGISKPEFEGNHSEHSKKQRIVQFFGNLKPYKGIDVLLQAFAEINSEEDIVLRISGRPRMEVEPLQRLARRLGVAERVEWDLRFVPEEEVPAIFREADLITLPYRTIDASGVLVKALLFGKPVVATDIGGISEYVENGEEGFLVPVEDHEALSGAMQKIISNDDLQAEMGRKARARADQIPSWDSIAEQTIRVYKDVRE